MGRVGGLVEIMARLLRQVGATQRPNGLGLYVDNAVLLLEVAIDDERRVLRDDQAQPLEDLRIDNGVGDARFIFKGNEHHAAKTAKLLSLS